MIRIPLHALSLSLLALSSTPSACTAAPAVVQPTLDAQHEPRTKGTIFKAEVDRLVTAIAERTHQDGTAAAYTTAVLPAAQLLCALAHCHRFYVASDNPRIRATIQVLLQARRRDGSFGAATDDGSTATAWVVDALAALDADGRYTDEVRTGRRLLASAGVASPWQSAVEQVLARVTAEEFPEHLGANSALLAAKAAAGPAEVDATDAIAALLELVACQQANRQLDRPQDAAPPSFTIAQQQAFAFLFTQQQQGVFAASFGGRTFPDPAFTGFGLLALQTKPKAQRTAAENAAIAAGIAWLIAAQNEDGSFGQQLQNYTTSVVVGALARYADPAHKPALDKAQKYILKCQNVEQSGYQSSDRDYGSIGYGGSQRGDLSNVNFALQALRESGLPAEDEAFQKALVFLRRTQNLKSVNDFAGKVSNPDDGGKLIDVTSGDDGGAAYYPGNSAAGYVVTPDGKSVPRSYGSMTYALLKSYTLCGVPADDERVQKAVAWLGANWTLDHNPGFDAPPGDKAHYAGLFYYYMVLAQALDQSGVATLERAGADGKLLRIDWRKELRARLEGMQRPGGAWINEQNSRWMENVDLLCTCYAMLALERCR